jgi:hypothetical protein
MLHWLLPSSESVAVGRVNVGPTPPDELAGLRRRQEERGVEVPQPEGALPLEQRRLVDDGHDGPGDEIPVLGQLERDHRLHVEDVDRRVLRAGTEVEVVLKRHADEVGHRVLRLLRQLRVASSASPAAHIWRIPGSTTTAVRMATAWVTSVESAVRCFDRCMTPSMDRVRLFQRFAPAM